MGSASQEMYRKTDLYQGKYLSIFIFLKKKIETCIMGANDDLDGKTTHDCRTKMSKTNHSVIVRLLNGGKA